ncbi:hypothetical protein niasHS_005813 [Heterodera schachtii]|uniref:DOMON domain-containing protein n=1 Tax=Heterodera schachtii TaxID=97005 RepID=A0ABD2K091_HETSC
MAWAFRALSLLFIFLLAVPSFAFAKALFPLGLDLCGKSRACWSTPPGCDSAANCQAIVRWRYEKNKLRVEMQAKGIGSLGAAAPVGAQWMALGFSDDAHMGNDTVFSCLFGTEGGNRAEISYNQWTDNIPLVEASKQMISERIFSTGKETNGCAISINYAHKLTSKDEQKMILRLNGKDWWHILFAQGPAARNTGQKDFHTTVHKSEQLVRICESCSDKLAVLQGVI